MASKIEWTDYTWNPVTGCSKISPGCQNCYAEKMTLRLQKMPANREKYRNGFKVTCHPEELIKPLIIPGRGKRIFVCSMSDLFHPDVSDAFVSEVFFKIFQSLENKHKFIILTKRPERIRQLIKIGFHTNMILGVSVENKDYLERIEWLRKSPIFIKRFVSFEPLLGSVGKIDLSEISWVIVGGESGPGARPMNGDWVREIRNQAVAAGIPFFYKQRMEGRKKISMPELDGRTWAEYPDLSWAEEAKC